MTPLTVRKNRAPNHARKPSIRAGVSRQSMYDPMQDEHFAGNVRDVVRVCSSQAKQLAKAAGVSESRARHWRMEGRGNPIYEATVIVHGLTKAEQGAGVIVAHLMSTIHQALLPMDADKLVERFFTLMREESEAEGAENAAQSTVGHTGDLADLRLKMMRATGTQVELIAVIRELEHRRIDPYRWTRTR